MVVFPPCPGVTIISLKHVNSVPKVLKYTRIELRECGARGSDTDRYSVQAGVPEEKPLLTLWTYCNNKINVLFPSSLDIKAGPREGLVAAAMYTRLHVEECGCRGCNPIYRIRCPGKGYQFETGPHKTPLKRFPSFQISRRIGCSHTTQYIL